MLYLVEISIAFSRGVGNTDKHFERADIHQTAKHLAYALMVMSFGGPDLFLLIYVLNVSNCEI